MNKFLWLVGFSFVFFAGNGTAFASSASIAVRASDSNAETNSESSSAMRNPSSKPPLEFSGDFLYRFEYLRSNSVASPFSRQRQRIRGRLGMGANPYPSVRIKFQLASGNDNPISAFQSLGNVFSSKAIRIDLLNLTWSPSKLEGLTFILGKMKNPFFRPGGTELLWDGDLRPEGAVVVFKPKFAKSTLTFIAGEFVVVERSSEPDTLLGGLQILWQGDLSESLQILTAGAFFPYKSETGIAPLDFSGGTDAFGNTTIGGVYVQDYKLLEGSIELRSDFGYPVSIFADFVRNSRANNGLDTGWLMGTRIGDKTKWGTVYYNYRRLDADALIGAVTDSTFANGGTSVQGHEIGIDFYIESAGKITFTHMDGFREINQGSKHRFTTSQASLSFKF